MSLDDVVRRAREGLPVKVPALAEASGRSRNALYQAIKRGELEAVWLGRAAVVPGDAALRLLGMKPNVSAPQASEPLAA
ncbi:hypothetical protein MKK67_11540 [Methylobacterium sp. J-072]|uniref:hypothetical protein n=1 Tax=Methylobacterium sp. J-072 TaxID=2836651 RepID=UPI001FBB9ED4|nr:hypothetical protein [Methylobacterium sp. J-072]MCJ2093124.1 hypothetical protein [Methylobacterium sp. J-072]